LLVHQRLEYLDDARELIETVALREEAEEVCNHGEHGDAAKHALHQLDPLTPPHPRIREDCGYLGRGPQRFVQRRQLTPRALEVRAHRLEERSSVAPRDRPLDQGASWLVRAGRAAPRRNQKG